MRLLDVIARGYVPGYVSFHVLGVMGAGASSALPASIDKATAQSFAGEQFDETAFDAAAKDGLVPKDEFLKAAKKVPGAGRQATVTSQCASLFSLFIKRLEEGATAENSRVEGAKLAAKAFWDEQERKPLWIVPLGEDSTFARHCGLTVALERARRAGKTPLLVDNSEERVIDTYYSYQRSHILEAKKLLVDERQGTARSELLERARAQLVKAMRFGQVLYVRLSNSACDFSNRYNGPDTLPLAIFDAAEVATFNEKVI